ncbi:hypothetical protein AM501_24130 [Aneurinibacillus migulanus]|uniref:hypothetical protein n=1 Tax=Aneurinibacillus migulanus TaxID=47500 RepID=UPI0005B8CF58|nr:hypothetical protein [Aneurinibacillus migulanus]KIV58904.1 hypothetical protein TS64_03850 [Aneurinibacillus migulanus]KPD05864.1 hypothetical protein AM501_24130 [Aneurinibacillus migulanus]
MNIYIGIYTVNGSIQPPIIGKELIPTILRLKSIVENPDEGFDYYNGDTAVVYDTNSERLYSYLSKEEYEEFDDLKLQEWFCPNCNQILVQSHKEGTCSNCKVPGVLLFNKIEELYSVCNTKKLQLEAIVEFDRNNDEKRAFLSVTLKDAIFAIEAIHYTDARKRKMAFDKIRQKTTSDTISKILFEIS